MLFEPFVFKFNYKERLYQLRNMKITKQALALFLERDVGHDIPCNKKKKRILNSDLIYQVNVSFCIYKKSSYIYINIYIYITIIFYN